MTSDDGAVALTYNGEVYNFRELRRELGAAGHRFRSTGDTEVVLRAYEHWGEDFVTRLDGMYALAVWDGRAGRLILARDRTGKKPLYYTCAGGRITFGSEIKALLAAPWVRPEPNLGKLAEFLTFGYVPNPHTLYAGIEQVPPASILTYDGTGAPAVREYWDAVPHDASAHGGDAPTIAHLLEAATVRRMIADVPLGALLSGGIDSSIVVGLMSRHASEPVRTFTIGFPESSSFDERPYARFVADHFGTRHTEYEVRADAVALMDALLWHHDQPYGDSSAIPTYLVSQLAADQVTVALNGDGGDEVFGGYDRFVAAAVGNVFPRSLAPVGRAAARALPRSDSYYSFQRRLTRFLELGDRPIKDRYQSWIAVVDEEVLADLLPPEHMPIRPGLLTSSMERWYERVRDAPELDQIIYANFKTYLPDDLAVKMDRMSMAHSLETRSPFLDTALIEHLAGVPARKKVGLRRVKPLLRRAFRDMLPDTIWNRRKHGFGVPLGLWFRTDLKQMFEDEVLARDARTSALLNRTAVEKLWEEHQRGQREFGHRLWTLLTLEHWLRSLDRPSTGGTPPVALQAAQESAESWRS